MSDLGERAAWGVRLVVAYDGSEFSGFQIQPKQRSVQGVLEDALFAMTGERARMRCAGRTDAGVHALGQVVAFDSARSIPERGWMLGLNHHLPEDVRVQSAALCAPGYQPRFDAVGKHYRYLIQQGEARNPLLRKRAWQLGRPAPLDGSPLGDVLIVPRRTEHEGKANIHHRGSGDWRAYGCYRSAPSWFRRPSL